MKKKIIAGILLVIALGIGIWGVLNLSSPLEYVTKNSLNNQHEVTPSTQSEQIKSISSSRPESIKDAEKAVLDGDVIYNSEKDYHLRELTPSDSNVQKMGEPFTTDEISYTVNNCFVTKKIGEFDIEDLKETPQDVKLDDNGNIQNNYSYVIVDVTIKNESQQTVEFYTNSLWLRLINSDFEYSNSNLFYNGQLRGYMDGKPAQTGKSYYRRFYDGGEERSCILTYVVQDSELENSTLLLKVWPSGSMHYEDNSRFVKLIQEDQ